MRKNKAEKKKKIDDLCRILHCRVEDIIEYVEE